MFGFLRRVSSGWLPRNDRPRPDDVTSTAPAPQTGSKRRRGADDTEGASMDVDAFGQRKKARSHEPETPTQESFPAVPETTVADEADAARDASPLPVSQSTEAAAELKDVTQGVKKVDLESEGEVAVKEDAKDTAEEAPAKVEEEKAETTSADAAAVEEAPAVDAPTSESVTEETPKDPEGPKSDDTSSADTTAPSDSETSTAVASSDATDAPVTSSSEVAEPNKKEATTESTPIHSSVSPEPMPAVASKE